MNQTAVPVGGRYNWLQGCGMGCVFLLIVGLAAVVGVYRISTANIRAKREALTEDVHAHYERLQKAGTIPAEHIALLEGAMQEAKRPEVGFFGLLLYGGAILSPFEDGTLTPEELKLLEETRAYLITTPAPSPMDYGDYVAARPLLQQEIAEFEAKNGDSVNATPQP